MNNNVDFLPQNYLEKKAQQRTNIICLILFIIVVAGVGTGFMLTQRRQSSLKNQASQICQQMAQASKTLEQLESLEKKKKQMMTKAKISAMLMDPVPRSLLLATITNNLPAGVSLTNYKLQTKEITNTTKTKKSLNKKAKSNDDKDTKSEIVPQKQETKIEFTGLAPTDIEVAQLIEHLNQSLLFGHVDLDFSEEHKIKDETMRRFKLTAILDQDAKASQKDVELARRKHIKGM